ncbi:DJ-1/PfpI family protein [Acetobacteraceae bacterium ESL0709]|nr:DJ-1/PfpI family protein [Acetobacteraceae bacterium ESL0697]MDF7678820.1 DJ-1/PfpI family protein [Acetobacteraceae bacterium ESL0709]
MKVIMLLYPNFTQLDLTGPFEVLGRVPDLEIEFVWKNTDLVACDLGLAFKPSHSFSNCSRADILFVPGGPGQLPLMQDGEVLSFIASQGQKAQWITSVCTGSLLLAAAGLLKGYRATSHWLSIDQLVYFGAIPVYERVVRDRNRVTGAGVTSGIDFALTFCAELFGEQKARCIQLSMEYDPEPPFHEGSPSKAAPETLEAVRAASSDFQTRRDEVARQVAAVMPK